MAGNQKKTAARKPRMKPTGKTGAEQAQEQQEPAMVQAMQPQAFQMVMEIIDNATVKGSEAGNVILLKNELCRVAGMQPRQPAE